MKNKIALFSIGIVAIALALIFLWPLSFEHVISNDTDLSIIITDLNVSNSVTSMDSATYKFRPDSEEFKQIKQILNQYSYHRSFRTFFDDTVINGKGGVDYSLQLYSSYKHIISMGTKEITVNNHIYRIGYWGNETSLKMMNEIRGFLENH